MTTLSSSLTRDPGDDEQAMCQICGQNPVLGLSDVCPDCDDREPDDDNEYDALDEDR